MDFSQLLCSGFQFLNLDDACEAEVEILTRMLFKQQDATQLSNLFHLKTLPDGESHYGKCFIDDGHHPGRTAGEGLCHGLAEEQKQQSPIVEHLQETVVVGADASIPIANGPIVPISPHHVINVDPNPADCAASGDINPPMIPTMPPPIRSYYSQQHVSMVHGSQAQVGSPGMGQPQHGQVGVVSPGYSHVQVPISMHQQPMIMMPAQPQGGHLVGMPPPVHFVQQRHHGHPPHNYVQGEHPLSPESVQYHHNPNLVKITHDPSAHSYPHIHPSHASTQGGPNKYTNGPRKGHSNRTRGRNDSDMMNNYQAYYQGMYPPGMVPGIPHSYNLQQQIALTGSPIIMQPASHHNKAPVTMYAPHHYSSPPPTIQTPVNPHMSPSEAQQPAVTGAENSISGSQQPPQLQQTTGPQHTGQERQEPECETESSNSFSSKTIQGGRAQDLPSRGENKVVAVNETGQSHLKIELPQPSVAEIRSQADVTPNHPSQSVDKAEESSSDGISSASHGASTKVTQDRVPPQASQSQPNEKSISSPPPVQINHDTVQVKGQSTASPVPDKLQDNVVNNKCSSPTTKENRIPSQLPNNQQATVPPAQHGQIRTQTWAETSAAKPSRALSGTNNPPSSTSNVSSGGGSDDKTLKEKQGQNKSSTEFPALGGKSNVNGTSSSNTVSSNVSGSPAVSAATQAPSTLPSQKSWASVVCKSKSASSQNSLPPTAGAGPANGAHGSATGQQVSASVSSGITHAVPQETNGSVPSTSSSSSAASSERHNPIQMTHSASDNNGHLHVPIQSQSGDRSKSLSTSTASHDLTFDTSCLNNESDALAIRLGEFLANYTLNHQATALTPRGLTNQSNFCYINATLQSLMACPPFVNLFRSMKEIGLAKTPCKATPIIQSVFDFVSEFEPLNRGNTSKRDRRNDSSFITGANLEPSGIRKVLGLFDGSTFKVEGRQQDAEEFLSHLLNGLHEEMIKVIKWYENSKSGGASSIPTQPQPVVNGQHPEVASEDDGDADNWQVMGPKNKGCVTRKTTIDKSPISEMLFGQLCSALQRTNDRNNVRNLQPFFTLQLDIQNDNIKSIRDALEGLSTKEEVSGLVSNSGQETTAWRQLSLEELPMILILHLKRFVYDKSGHKIQKLDKKLEFGIDLEIGKELLSVNTRNKWLQKQRTYKLFAVVYHDGEEAYKGHYIADCFHPSGGNIWGQVGWLRYDDITVKPIADSAMLNSQPPRVPYLLYYRRADTLVSHHPQAPRKDRPRNFGSVSES